MFVRPELCTSYSHYPCTEAKHLLNVFRVKKKITQTALCLCGVVHACLWEFLTSKTWVLAAKQHSNYRVSCSRRFYTKGREQDEYDNSTVVMCWAAPEGETSKQMDNASDMQAPYLLLIVPWEKKMLWDLSCRSCSSVNTVRWWRLQLYAKSPLTSSFATVFSWLPHDPLHPVNFTTVSEVKTKLWPAIQ